MSQRLSSKQARIRLIALGVPNFSGGDTDGNGDGNDSNSGVPNPREVADRTSGSAAGTEDDDDDDDDIDDPNADLKKKLARAKDAKDRRIIELSDENAQKRVSNKNLKTERDALQAKLDEYERKEQSDLDNATGDLKKKTDRISKLEATLQKNLLETAILKDDGFTWHDVSDVISAITGDALTIDLEEGTIEGLGPELKRIAVDKPHYVKSKKSEKKKDEGQNNGAGPDGKKLGASGINPGGAGSSGDAAATQRAELINKYPALANLGRR